MHIPLHSAHRHGDYHESNITPHMDMDMDMGCKESDGSSTSDTTAAPTPCHHTRRSDTAAIHGKGISKPIHAPDSTQLFQLDSTEAGTRTWTLNAIWEREQRWECPHHHLI